MEVGKTPYALAQAGRLKYSVGSIICRERELKYSR